MMKKMRLNKLTKLDLLLYFLKEPIEYKAKKIIEDHTGITRMINHNLLYKGD